MTFTGNGLANQNHVAKKTSPRPNTLAFTAKGGRRKSLIEWNDSSRQAQVLDWHHRAQEFGLDVEEHEDADSARPYDVDPKRLLEHEEPEAFARQRVADDEEFDREQEEERFEPGVNGREDVDLVRVYLQHIGRRKLLKAHEEVVLGERIENAQHALVGVLGEIPSAVQTLISL